MALRVTFRGLFDSKTYPKEPGKGISVRLGQSKLISPQLVAQRVVLTFQICEAHLAAGLHIYRIL